MTHDDIVRQLVNAGMPRNTAITGANSIKHRLNNGLLAKADINKSINKLVDQYRQTRNPEKVWDSRGARHLLLDA